MYILRQTSEQVVQIPQPPPVDDAAQETAPIDVHLRYYRLSGPDFAALVLCLSQFFSMSSASNRALLISRPVHPDEQIPYPDTEEGMKQREADFRKIVDTAEATGQFVNLSDFKTTKDLEADAKTAKTSTTRKSRTPSRSKSTPDKKQETATPEPETPSPDGTATGA